MKGDFWWGDSKKVASQSAERQSEPGVFVRFTLRTESSSWTEETGEHEKPEAWRTFNVCKVEVKSRREGFDSLSSVVKCTAIPQRISAIKVSTNHDVFLINQRE